MHVLVSCVGTVLGRLKVPASWQAFAGGEHIYQARGPRGFKC